MAYPTSVATDADLYLVKNQLATQLDGSITNVQTTITVDSTTGFPTVGVITIDSEVIKYTGVTATQFTGCTRGFDGTGAASHTDNAPVRHAVTAIHHNALKDELIAVETHLIPGQHTGTATNDNAAAGKVGQYIFSAVGSTSFPATTAYGDLTSISLTAGDWLVTGHMTVEYVAGTMTVLRLGISTTAGNNSTGLTIGDTLALLSPLDATRNLGHGTIAPLRISLNATTTVYLKFRSDYTSTAPNGYGRLSAWRIR